MSLYFFKDQKKKIQETFYLFHTRMKIGLAHWLHPSPYCCELGWLFNAFLLVGLMAR